MRLFSWFWKATVAAALALLALPAFAGDALWTAGVASVPIETTAFGVVAPRAVITVRAGETGFLQDFLAQPGDAVSAGAVLARLSGPSIDVTLAARQSAQASAEAALEAAQKGLASEREKGTERLATQAAVATAAAAASEAEARLATARAQLAEAQDLATLEAPQAGRVLTVAAASGERIDAGQPVLTLEPIDDLRLRASFYGTEADAIRPGMTGEFASADGGAAMPVKVRAVVGALQSDGGRLVELTAEDAATPWINGEAGTVTIPIGKLSGVTVPTRALILDQAKWWVLVHTTQGDQPQSVALGPSHGALTLITRGLAPGTQVVVANAYLGFHRGIGAHYQPPY